jgi:Transcriptional regulator, AbiEi antitoxin
VSVWFHYGTILTFPRKRTLRHMLRSRFDELLALAGENDGLVTASQARAIGIVGSVLARSAQRGKLKRVARGVYRIPHYPADRLSQYREAVSWARASHEPENVGSVARDGFGGVWDFGRESVTSVHYGSQAGATAAPEAQVDRDSSRGIDGGIDNRARRAAGVS